VLAGHDPHYLHVVWAVATVMGVAVLVALVIAYRRAARRLEIEEVDRVITDHDRGVP
jgi:hypothetical protein